MNKMKNFSTLLIIAGIIIMAIPIVGRLYTNHVQEKMYEQYISQLNQLEEIGTLDVSDITTDAAVSTDETASSKVLPSAIEKNVIGTVSIPSIDANQLLLEGSASQQLKYGVGHIVGTAFPGESGNCAIAGHRNYTFGTYFNRLEEVENGDFVEVSYNNNSYTYEIYESFVVLPTEVSVLDNVEGDSIVTLITCHPKGKNSHRLIVRGRLI